MAHGRHGGAGVDGGGGEVGAEGVTEGVDVDDAAARVVRGDSGGLEVGVEDMDGGWTGEEFALGGKAVAEGPSIGLVTLSTDTFIQSFFRLNASTV